jgi:hypothetical protein
VGVAVAAVIEEEGSEAGEVVIEVVEGVEEVCDFQHQIKSSTAHRDNPVLAFRSRHLRFYILILILRRLR